MDFGRDRESAQTYCSSFSYQNKTNLTRLSLNRRHVRACADLSVLPVRRGVVGDLEEVQVNHFFHLVVVPSTLAYDHCRIEQEDVPAVQGASSRSHYF